MISLAWSMRLVRLAHLCFPRRFRDRYGAALLQTIHDRLQSDWHRRSLVGRGALVLKTVARTAADGCLERLRPVGGRRERWAVATDVVRHECRGALRSVRRRPAFFAGAVGIQAVGIGAAAAIFGALDGVVLRPLPYPEPERLVVIGRSVPQFGDQLLSLSLPVVHDLREQAQVFEAVAAVRSAAADAIVAGTARRMAIAGVSAGFFDMVGARPAAGQLFHADHDAREAPAHVIISYGLAVRVFASAHRAVGQPIAFDGVEYHVLGVTPPAFAPPDGLGMAGTEAWFPLRRMFLDRPIDTRGRGYFRVLGRLAHDVEMRTAASALESFAASQQAGYPDAFGSDPFRLLARPLHGVTVAGAAPRLWLLMGAVMLFVAIGAVNLVGLFLARATDRHGELALRAALGASRARLGAHALTESVLAAGLAAVVGLALASFGVQLFHRIPADQLPRADNVALDWRVAAFALGTALVTGVMVGLTPAIRAARVIPGGRFHTLMRSHGGRNRHRARQALLGVETALALILTVGAGAFLQTLARLNAVDLGFSGRNVLRAEVHLGATFFQRSREAQLALQDDVRRAVESIPGAARVTSTFSLPLQPYAPMKGGVSVAGEDAPDRVVESDLHTWVGSGYFATLRVPVLDGREFAPEDLRQGGEGRVVISRGLATRLWGAVDVSGRRLRVPSWGAAPADDWFRVIGVVGDVAARGPREGAVAAIYFPDRASVMGPPWNLLIRHDADGQALASLVRETITRVAPDVPIGTVEPLDVVHARAFAEPRFFALVLGTFAGVAMILAMAGIHSTLAYVVSTTMRELGIRVALGACTRHVRRRILRIGIVPVVIGLVAGGVAITAIGPSLASVVRDLSVPGAPVIAGAATLIIFAAALASWGPARRAEQTDPVAVMRQ